MGANVGTQGIHHKTTPSTPIKEADKVNAKAAANKDAAALNINAKLLQ
jgi:hypothetical protein